MNFKKGSYPYPEENVFLVLGGPNEEFTLNHPFTVKNTLEKQDFVNNVHVLNKIVNFTAVSKNKKLVDNYATEIMPEWWSTYNILSLKEIKSWLSFSKEIVLEKGEKWLINLSDKTSLVIEGKDLDFFAIKTIIEQNMGEDMFCSTIPLVFVEQTIVDMEAIRTGLQEERFVFDLESNELNDYIDDLFLSLPQNQQSKIIQDSKK